MRISPLLSTTKLAKVPWEYFANDGRSCDSEGAVWVADIDAMGTVVHQDIQVGEILRRFEEPFVRTYLFQHPRRSCDAFAAATLMCNPWHDNPFPAFESLAELQDWVGPLIDEEVGFDERAEPLSGKPLAPNVETAL